LLKVWPTREIEFQRLLNRWRERENEETVLVDMEGDDSDEEGDVVSAEWSQTGFGEY
jgi:hypothetical protein